MSSLPVGSKPRHGVWHELTFATVRLRLGAEHIACGVCGLIVVAHARSTESLMVTLVKDGPWGLK